MTDAKRSELRALNIYTVEALAELDGQPLKNLGIGGRDWKNKAMEYLASSNHEATVMRQQSQIEALMTQIRLLEDDKKLLAAGPRNPAVEDPPGTRPPVPPEPPESRTTKSTTTTTAKAKTSARSRPGQTLLPS